MAISDRTLEAFLLLAELQKFTLAAERCNMTQSALSQLVARLEDHLGVLLFERGKRAVTLTPEGERFAVSARRVTNELRSAKSDLKSLATLERGQVAMAVVPSLAAYWLPKILRIYRQQFPFVRIQLSDASSARCQELARQGLVDFALSSQPGEPEELESELLFEEALYIAFPAGHPLAIRTKLTLVDLQGVDFIHIKGLQKMLMRVGSVVLPARQLLHDAGTVDIGLEVENLATQAGLVAAGLGACLTPACSLPQFGVPGVAIVQLDPGSVVRPIYLSRRRGVSLSVAANGFLREVHRHIKTDGTYTLRS